MIRAQKNTLGEGVRPARLAYWSIKCPACPQVFDVRDLGQAVVFAFGVIAWVLVAERPQKSSLRMETARSLNADPDLRLVSERSEYMRTER
jgi:hypothetical protein